MLAYVQPSAWPAQGPPCPLCRQGPGQLFTEISDGAVWYACPSCALVYRPPGHLPDSEREYREYRRHTNSRFEAGYRRFLSKLAEPLLAVLPPGSQGLDYGCGPGPALAQMLEEAGHGVALYDPFFAPDPSPLAATYDFVTCTETAEHFHDPAGEVARLVRLVRPGGWLALMTGWLTAETDFIAWGYRRDPTHVALYSRATMAWIAAAFGCTLTVPRKDVALLRKG